MKEENVWLSPEELEHMLLGSLLWSDLEPRIGTSRAGIRKLGGAIPKKQSTPTLTEPREVELPKGNDAHTKGFEGRPVIWLLGSVGLLTLSSWFYFVLFSR